MIFDHRFTTGENLHPWQRELIEKQLNTKVHDGYGGGETNSIAYQCGIKNNYHITAEHVIINTKYFHSSEKDNEELLITDLDNYDMPFINYRIGDIIKQSDEDCSCGREIPKGYELHSEFSSDISLDRFGKLYKKI